MFLCFCGEYFGLPLFFLRGLKIDSHMLKLIPWVTYPCHFFQLLVWNTSARGSLACSALLCFGESLLTVVWVQSQWNLWLLLCKEACRDSLICTALKTWIPMCQATHLKAWPCSHRSKGNWCRWLQHRWNVIEAGAENRPSPCSQADGVNWQ